MEARAPVFDEGGVVAAPGHAGLDLRQDVVGVLVVGDVVARGVLEEAVAQGGYVGEVQVEPVDGAVVEAFDGGPPCL